MSKKNFMKKKNLKNKDGNKIKIKFFVIKIS